jgi:hypothetical protein
MSVHIFGIRHHGPGSARSLCQALTELQPDIVLVEGPPEAESVLPLLSDPQMKPPVALVLYEPDNPQQAIYYPFAQFSPEWQALQYGLQQKIPVRFMDLPISHHFALDAAQQAIEQAQEEEQSTAIDESHQSAALLETDEIAPMPIEAILPHYRHDPLSLLAAAAGYNDGERWWEHLVETRQDSTALFTAILEAMIALRGEVEQKVPIPQRELRREAYMRKTIREAQQAGHQRIAVVCGAWHAPALAEMPSAKADQAVLKGLPKVKVGTAWIPWSYGRLTMASGYGAGIASPGWYHHLWETTGAKGNTTENGSLSSRATTRWMAKVAHHLRRKDLDASSASVIEAVRLAETLAAMRHCPLPGLDELNEAVQTVLCFGDPFPMQLIHQQLIVGERLGKVPKESPMVPLQQEFQRQLKRLRLKLSATENTLELDLRKPLDLERSQFLHRLLLIELPWGKQRHAGNTKGTFKELWALQWEPEFELKLIEAGVWGNSVETAAQQHTCDRARTGHLPTLTELIDHTLLANLPQTIAYLMERLQAEATISSDLTHLMQALPPLVNISRYGTVRQLDAALIESVVEGILVRICIGLPAACASLDDDAAAQFYQQIVAVHSAIGLLRNQEHLILWQQTLLKLADQQGLHGLIAGRCCRLLFESGQFTSEETANHLSVALSTASEPIHAGAWIEGFLSGSGLLLLHNNTLWQVLDTWVIQLAPEAFTTILPLLRRTFGTFPSGERRQMGDRVRQGTTTVSHSRQPANIDHDRADTVLPLLAQLLGLSL